MKILVKSRKEIEKSLEKKDIFYTIGNFISIYSSEYLSDECYSPLPDRYNVLSLQFDDVTEEDRGLKVPVIFFNESLANQIKDFVLAMNHNKKLYIHCDAGISRSGAVGDVLNEYFNKYIEDNPDDYKFFLENNKQIQPNSLVKKLLKDALFEKVDYNNLWKEIKS